MRKSNEIDKKLKAYSEQIYPKVETAKGMAEVLKKPKRTIW